MEDNVLKHFDKENMHHAYLIEGEKEDLTSKVLGFLENMGIQTIANPDFCRLTIDSLKIDEARLMRSWGNEKSTKEGKKVFFVCTNSITLDAQQALLKLFEEPTPGTHFFIIMPDTGSLLRTVRSRFYFIAGRQNNKSEEKEAKRFIELSKDARINFLKDLLTEEEEENIEADSVRAKAQSFLNSLEESVHLKFVESPGSIREVNFFEHVFKVRKFLRQPGSSVKSLMEGVALTLPNF